MIANRKELTQMKSFKPVLKRYPSILLLFHFSMIFFSYFTIYAICYFRKKYQSTLARHNVYYSDEQYVMQMRRESSKAPEKKLRAQNAPCIFLECARVFFFRDI